MFFIHDLERVLILHPSFFGANMREHLVTALLDQVEGLCTGRYYIICVMETTHISKGRIIPGSGIAEFTIQYKALVWKPFKGETVSKKNSVFCVFLSVGANSGLQSMPAKLTLEGAG